MDELERVRRALVGMSHAFDGRIDALGRLCVEVNEASVSMPNERSPWFESQGEKSCLVFQRPRPQICPSEVGHDSDSARHVTTADEKPA